MLEFRRLIAQHAQCGEPRKSRPVEAHYASEQDVMDKLIEILSRPGIDIVRTGWTPGSRLKIPSAKSKVKEEVFAPKERTGKVWDEDVSPETQGKLNAWMDRNDISATGDLDTTLALIIQTALALQNFDPGPRDGKIGRKTLAAIVAWQLAMQILVGTDLSDVIAAILRAALVLEGYDPGPVEEMFGPTAIEAAQAWAPSYEKAARNQGSRDRNDRLSPPTSWRTVPHAKDCVSFVRSGGAGNYQFIRNDCDFKIDVHWCYTDRPGDNDYCAPGRAGIGYMDRVGHKATRRGAGPDYYADSDGLRARETSPKRLRRGAIRYIACGHRPLRNAQQYVTEWDAHTAKFRCLAYAPEQDDRTPAEGTAE